MAHLRAALRRVEVGRTSAGRARGRARANRMSTRQCGGHARVLLSDASRLVASEQRQVHSRALVLGHASHALQLVRQKASPTIHCRLARHLRRSLTLSLVISRPYIYIFIYAFIYSSVTIYLLLGLFVVVVLLIKYMCGSFYL